MEQEFKGFLHKDETGAWQLCDAPNLKSCCITSHKIVSLEGDFSAYRPERPVKARGLYEAEAQTLKNVAITETKGSFPAITLGGAFLILILLLARRKLARLLLP